MTADDILKALGEEGVEITQAGDSLKVRATKGRLSEEQKRFITENKAALLARLGAQQAPPVPPTPSIAAGAAQEAPQTEEIFKEYVYPNGEVLRLTKDEFMNVVGVFRMLYMQDALLRKQGRRV